MINLPEGQLHPYFTVGGIDFSYAQGSVNFDKAKQRGVKFSIIRGGQSTVIDTRFYSHRNLVRRSELPWAVYWYWHPNYLEAIQARKFKDVVGSFRPPMGVFIDLERSLHPSVEQWRPEFSDKRKVGEKICAMFDICDSLFSCDVGIYTGASFWREWVLPRYQQRINPNRRNRWLAQYLYQFGRRPNLPDNWSDWEIWQFSAETGPWAFNAGAFGVTGSTHVDVNVFNGDDDEFKRKFHLISGPGTLINSPKLQ